MLEEDKYYNAAEAASKEPWTSEDAHELEQILSNRTMLKALGGVLMMTVEQTAHLAKIDLNTPQAINDATKTQGIVQGIQLAASELIRLANEKQETQDAA